MSIIFVTEVKYLKCIFFERRINILHEFLSFLMRTHTMWYRVYFALNSVFFCVIRYGAKLYMFLQTAMVNRDKVKTCRYIKIMPTNREQFKK